MSVEYFVRKNTQLAKPGKVIEAEISGTKIRILLTPLQGISEIMSIMMEDYYTLVTLLDYPFTSYPFDLPLAEYVGSDYILEKLYSSDQKYAENAEKLCYLLKKNAVI